jgi:hypothetical protein
MLDLALTILIRTPLWVWLILLLTLLWGGWALRPHTLSPARLAILPLVAAGISVWKRYVLGVFLAFHRQPDFDALRALAPNAIGGLAAGLVLGWLCGLLWQYRLAPVRARP